MTDISYTYRPKPLIMLVAGGFFALCFFPIYDMATHNQQGLIINHIITLSVEQATLFFWGLTVACVLFVVAAIFGIIKGMTSKAAIRLSDTAITVPQGLFRQSFKTIPYADVTDLSSYQINSQTFLNIHYAGRKVSVVQSMMPSKTKYEDMVRQLTDRIALAREAAREAELAL